MGLTPFRSDRVIPPTSVIVDKIDEFRNQFRVDPTFTVLRDHGMKIAPSTYYAVKKRVRFTAAAHNEAYTANTVHRLYLASRRLCGMRKMRHAMKRAGRNVGRDQVDRLTTICGAAGVVRGRRLTATTVRDHQAPRRPDLVDRQWRFPARPDHWWVDFTYCWSLSGFGYAAFVVDVFSRRILGWRVVTTKATPLVSWVLKHALCTPQNRLRLHCNRISPSLRRLGPIHVLRFH